MDSEDSRPIDYKTHILIGIRTNGVMAVICDWPHVPSQDEVRQEIAGVRDGYATFALCTPTWIIPADDSVGGAAKGKPPRSRG